MEKSNPFEPFMIRDGQAWLPIVEALARYGVEADQYVLDTEARTLTAKTDRAFYVIAGIFQGELKL